MKVYAVIEVENNRVIALHNKKKIANRYCNSMKRFHNLDLSIIKVDKSKLKKINHYNDLFLVRCGDTYVQAGYVDDYEIYSEQTIYDFQKTKDILLRLLETDDNMDKNERKHLEKTLIYIHKKLQEEKEYVPELSRLKSIKLENEELRLSRTMWDERY